MARNARAGLGLVLVVIVLIAACGHSASTATTATSSLTSNPTSTLPVTTSSIPAPTSSTTTTVTTLPPTTTSTTLLPEQPQAESGWALEPGDLLVANGNGVHLLRDGQMVGTLVTTPTEVAMADGLGGLIIQMPDPDMYPEAWPDAAGFGGDALWRVSPDGDVQLAFRATPLPDAWTLPDLGLLAIQAVAPLSGDPTVLFVENTHYPGGGVSYLHLWALPLDGRTEPVEIPADLPGEGSVTGLGWQPGDQRLLMSTTSDGGEWFSAWDLSGGQLDWPTNPAARGALWSADRRCRCVWTLTTIPESSLIAYVESADLPQDSPSDLVLYDTRTGHELDRLPVADPWAFVMRLHSDGETVAITRTAWRDSFEYLPVLLYDVSTGVITELDLAGVATLVAPRWIL
ncbi:MAG: hypothetical protein FJW79_10110 [Actinobacteria bacterium]|nr:hypothetical protein [Actinomycetota bacterium]